MRLHINHKEDKIFQPLAREILSRNRGKSTGENTTDRPLADIKEDTKLGRNKSVSKVESTHASRIFNRKSTMLERTAEAYNLSIIKSVNVPVYSKAAERKQNKVQFVTRMYSKPTKSKLSGNEEARQYKSFYSEFKRSHHISRDKARSVSSIKTVALETASKQPEDKPQDRSFNSKPSKPNKISPISLKPLPASHLDPPSPSSPPKTKQDIDKKLAVLMSQLKKPTIKRIKSERTCNQDPTKALRDEVDFLLKYVYQCDESTKSMISSYMLSNDLKES
jgi:hypothetical protein